MTLRRALTGLLYAAGPLLLWVALRAILAVDRGLELVDESLYLLDASPPSETAAWGFPYGWHTAPLLRLVDGDVSDFRTLGALLLVLASAALGAAAWDAGRRSERPSSVIGSMLGAGQAAQRTAAITAAAVVSLAYYTELLRSPSYNWLNVLGTILAAVGVLRLAPHLPLRSWSRRALAFVTIAGFGLFLTIPAKPSTPILFAVLVAIVVGRQHGPMQGVRLVVAMAASSTLFLGVALATRLWPLEFLEVFLRALRLPVQIESQTVPGALGNLLLVPTALLGRPSALVAVGAVGVALLERWRPAAIRRPAILAVVGAATLVASVRWLEPARVAAALRGRPSDVVLTMMEGRPAVSPIAAALLAVGFGTSAQLLLVRYFSGRRRAVPAILIAAIAVGLAITGAEGWLLGRLGHDVGQPAQITTALVGLLAVVTLLRWGTSGPAGVGRSTDVARMSPTGVAVLLVGSAFITGFGSGNGAFGRSGLAAPLLAGAAIAVVAADPLHSRRRVLVTVVTLATTVLTSVQLLLQHRDPYWYPSAPVSTNVAPVSVGPSDSVLLLEPTIAATIAELRASAARAGWRPGMPLAALNESAATLTYLLGARAPETTLLSMYSPEQLDHTLNYVDPDEWSSAWIVVEPDPGGEGSGYGFRVTSALARRFAEHVGRTFPDDYETVWNSLGNSEPFLEVELWRPRDLSAD